MDVFISSYKKLSKEELQSVVSDLPHICLKGKRELVKGANEQKIELDAETINNIEFLAEEEYVNEIKMSHLDALGFTYSDEDGVKRLVRSRRSKRSNSVALFWGILFSLAVLGAMQMWTSVFMAEELAFGKLLLASAMTALGVYGTGIIIRTVDRMIAFKGFCLLKYPSHTNLRYREDTDLIERELSASAELQLDEKEENVTGLCIVDKETKLDIFEYKSLNHEQKELLRKLCAYF